MSSPSIFGRASARLIFVILTVVASLSFDRTASATTRVEVLVIGNNEAPREISTASELPDLRFADDDAAAFYDFLMPAADHGQLLTLMDRETQEMYPALVPIARMPTLRELKVAVHEIGQRLAQYKARGERSVLFIFFSGHGTLDGAGVPELALMDGGITRAFLYDAVLDQLPADAVHLFVDACHAEAIVRPRDVEAEAVDISADEVNAALMRSTLARYPRVGAILAAASDSRAYEWGDLRQGVFTHELLSALRGGADVNQDGRIEYSEVNAFLSAANRRVDDARAHLSIVARPPNADRRVSIVDSSMFLGSSEMRLTAIRTRAGPLHIEDDVGRRLATLHGEPGYEASLWLPAGRTIYLRAGQLESHFRASAGSSLRFSALRFVIAPTRARGALDDALRRGLFSMQFGRGYYSGFVAGDPDFIPVSLLEAPAPTQEQAPSTLGKDPNRGSADTGKISRRALGFVVAGTGAAGLAVGGVFGYLSLQAKHQQTDKCASATACPDPSGASAAHDSAVVKGRVSTVAFVAGALTTTAGIALIVMNGTVAHKAPGPKLSLVTDMGPGAASVRFGAEF